MLGSAGVVAMSVSVERRIGRFEPEPHNPASSIQHPVSVSAPIGVDTRYDQHRVSSIQHRVADKIAFKTSPSFSDSQPASKSPETTDLDVSH